MNKSDEMFKEIDYIKDDEKSYHKVINHCTEKYIDFFEDKTVSVYFYDRFDDDYKPGDISIKELQAIIQKLKEKGVKIEIII